MNHRTPASKTWELAHRGKLLWEQLVGELADPLAAIGWQNTGLSIRLTLAALHSHIFVEISYYEEVYC